MQEVNSKSDEKVVHSSFVIRLTRLFVVLGSGFSCTSFSRLVWGPPTPVSRRPVPRSPGAVECRAVAPSAPPPPLPGLQAPQHPDQEPSFIAFPSPFHITLISRGGLKNPASGVFKATTKKKDINPNLSRVSLFFMIHKHNGSLFIEEEGYPVYRRLAPGLLPVSDQLSGKENRRGEVPTRRPPGDRSTITGGRRSVKCTPDGCQADNWFTECFPPIFLPPKMSSSNS